MAQARSRWSWRSVYWKGYLQYVLTMAKDQLQALLLKLKDDAELQEKLKSATNLDDAVILAKEAGFDVSKADWLSNKRLIGAHLLWEWSWI